MLSENGISLIFLSFSPIETARPLWLPYLYKLTKLSNV